MDHVAVPVGEDLHLDVARRRDVFLYQHARIAEAYGLKAWRVEDPAELRPALAQALEAGGPTLVDVVTQPLHEARAPVSEWVA